MQIRNEIETIITLAVTKTIGKYMWNYVIKREL